MNKFIGTINVIIIFLLLLFVPIILLPKMTFGYAFLTYLCTFVVYAVYEYAKILGLNNEILDISPPERIFKPIKLKPFLVGLYTNTTIVLDPPY